MFHFHFDHHRAPPTHEVGSGSGASRLPSQGPRVSGDGVRRTNVGKIDVGGTSSLEDREEKEGRQGERGGGRKGEKEGTGSRGENGGG